VKKYLIPLLACTALVGGGIALADAPPKPPDGAMHRMSKEDMQRHRTEMCSNMYAFAAGRMAFVEAKLSLSPAQEGAFDKWKGVKLSEAKAHSAKCASMPMPDMAERGSPVEHMAHEEERLKMRLADLQTERPVLAAFYNTLNDTQKHELAMAGHGMRGGMMHGRMGHGPMGHDGMGHGPMGHGPMEHGPMDGGPDGPPPPDAPGE
jgi:hypothetical protein